MPPSCPQCGADAGGRFCGRCGAYLGGGPRAARGAGRARRPWVRLLVVLAVVALGGLAVWVTAGDDPAARDVEVPRGAAGDDGTDPGREGGDRDAPLPESEPATGGPGPEIVCLADADCIAWRVDVGDATPPVVAGTPDGRVVVATAADEVTVTSLEEDGTRAWRADGLRGGLVAARPATRGRADLAVVGDLVLVGGPRRRHLTALDAATGEVRWHHALGGGSGRTGMLTAAELVAGTLVVHQVIPAPGGGDDGRPRVALTGLDPATGASRWSREGRSAGLGHGWATLLDDGVLRRLDARTGEERWAVDGVRVASPSVTSGPPGPVHLAPSVLLLAPGPGADARARLLDAADGATRAEIDAGSIAWHPEGRLPVLTVDGDAEALRALDAAGDPRWEAPLALDGSCCPRVIAGPDGRVLLAARGDRAAYRVLDAAGGVVHEGRSTVTGEVHGLSGPDTLLASSGDRPADMTALAAADGRPLWRIERTRLWPRPQQGLALLVIEGELLALDVTGD